MERYRCRAAGQSEWLEDRKVTVKSGYFINPSRIMATMLLSGSLHEQATK